MLMEQVAGWMKKIRDQTPAGGFIIGLSGGIDSAVAAGLAKQAAGDDHLCLIMPCESQPGDREAAEEIAEILGLKTRLIDLTPALHAMKSILPDSTPLQMGNLKARLRMMTLYHFAQSLNYLVVGTGNKTEYLLGYFTKYGDGAADLAPLQDLLKRDVRMIGKELGLPDKFINRPPSAGLWEGQSDEDEIGFTYEILDQAIVGLEKGSAIVPFKAMERVIEMSQKSEHKRNPVPKFIKPDHFII